MKWGIRRTPEQLGHKIKKKIKFTIKTPSQRKEEAYQKKIAKLEAKDEDLKRREDLKRKQDDIKKREAALKAKPKSEETEQKKNQNGTLSTNPIKRKSVKDMTDEELRDALSRYDLEKRYNTMLSEISKKNISAGQRKVLDILSKSASSVAQTYTTKAMTALVEAALQKMKKKNNSSGGNNGGGGGSS